MRRIATSSIAATALLVTAACGSSDDGSSSGSNGGPDQVKVGAIPIVDVAPLHLGIEKGFFSEAGIEVEVVNTTGGAAVPGVVSGEFDFAFGNVVSLIVARSQGLPLKAAEGSSSTGVDGADFGGIVVPADSPIQSASELSGKTVAVNNLNNIGDTTVRASIRRAGGDPSGVNFVELAFPDMPAAVSNQRVDAAWIVEPFFTLAQDQGARVIASNFVDTAPNLTIAAYFTTERVIQEDSDLTERFTAAIEKSLQYAQDNPEEARQVLTTGRHLVHESLAEQYVDKLAEKANHLPVGNPAAEQVALGPIIDEKQRDKVHSLVTSSVESGARLVAGGTYEGLFYRPTVLADVTPQTPGLTMQGPIARYPF